MMVTGARHDSVPGMYSMQRATQVMGYRIDNGCFDAAHDATDFYRTSRDVWKMNPFIPLNNTNEGNIKNLTMSSITNDGIPYAKVVIRCIISDTKKTETESNGDVPSKHPKRTRTLSAVSSTYVQFLIMVGWSIHIPRITPAYTLSYPEYPKNGRILMTTGRPLRGFSKERRTISNSLPSRPGQRSVFSFTRYSQPLEFMLTHGISRKTKRRKILLDTILITKPNME